MQNEATAVVERTLAKVDSIEAHLVAAEKIEGLETLAWVAEEEGDAPKAKRLRARAQKLRAGAVAR